MKNLLKYLSFIAIISFLFYHLTILLLPNVIYATFERRAKEASNRKDNELFYSPLPTDQSRSVVMPNPDFLYISCFYDVSESPLRLTGIMPDSSYWSVAFYQPNTINWYIKNDLQYGTNQLDLIVAKKGENLAQETNSEIAYSPVTKGLLLFRILVTDDNPDVVKQFEALQHSVKLEAL